MHDLKATVGQPVKASKWNRLVDQLGKPKDGFPAGGFQMDRVECLAKNTSGSNRDIGEAMVIKSWFGPTDSAYTANSSPLYEIEDPVWATKISNAVILAEPIPNGEIGRVVISGHCIAKISGAVGANDHYMMFDPSSENELTGSESGIARLLAGVSSGFAGVLLGDRQPLWLFELTEAPTTPTTTAKLVQLDGTEFSSAVEISDPTGIFADVSAASGTEGQCVHVGNSFYVVDAECG